MAQTQTWADMKFRVHVKGSIKKRFVVDSRALLHTLALFCLGHTLEKRNSQTAFLKLTLSGGPFKTSQLGFGRLPDRTALRRAAFQAEPELRGLRRPFRPDVRART